MEQLTKLGNELKSGLEALKGAQEQQKRDTDSLIAEKIARIADDVAEKVETLQKGQEQLKAALDRPGFVAAAEREEKSAEDKKQEAAFAKMLRRGTQGLGAEELKALSTDSDPDGGYFIPKVVAGKVNARIFETSPMMQLATVLNVSSKSVNILLDDDQAGFSWDGENDAPSANTTPQIGNVEITAKKGRVQVIQSSEVIQDAMFDVMGWMEEKVADKMTRGFNTAFVNGDGIRAPKGFLTGTIATSSTYARGTIEAVANGSSSAVTETGLIALQGALKQAYHANATWFMRRATFAKVLQISGTNFYRFVSLQPTVDNKGITLEILGRPVVFADDMPDIASNAYAIAFGDFKRFYTITNRAEISTIVDPYTQPGQVKVTAFKRMGGAVTNFEAVKLLKMA